MPNVLSVTANDHIEQKLDDYVGKLEAILRSDVLIYQGSLVGGVDDVIRGIVEEKRQQHPTNPKLTVILTTLGGYIEVVQRIVDILRHHYKTVEFIVPNYAYSAGTVLVMSGDEIWMDYFSRLGPIDPQVETRDGRAVPALGYLKQWERLITKAEAGKITLPEIQLMIQRFDQAELYQYEQARELSISLLEEWLAKYKFKNWKKTETRGLKVTQKIRKERANEIASALNDTDKWHTHGYGISMEVLQKRLKLLIKDFEKNPELRCLIRDYQDLLEDYMTKMGQEAIIHIKGHYHQLMERGESINA